MRDQDRRHRGAAPETAEPAVTEGEPDVPPDAQQPGKEAEAATKAVTGFPGPAGKAMGASGGDKKKPLIIGAAAVIVIIIVAVIASGLGGKGGSKIAGRYGLSDLKASAYGVQFNSGQLADAMGFDDDDFENASIELLEGGVGKFNIGDYEGSPVYSYFIRELSEDGDSVDFTMSGDGIEAEYVDGAIEITYEQYSFGDVTLVFEKTDEKGAGK